MTDSVEDLLARFQQQGETVSRSDSFTLAAGRALEKLRNFQLASPGLWLVKLVQAAVASDSSQIHIKLLGRGVSFSFDGDLGCSALEVLENLVSAERSSNPALNHLTVGLRSIYDPQRTVLWACAHQGQATSVRIHQGEHTLGDASDQLPKGFQLVLSQGEGSGSLFHWRVGQTIEELQCLYFRCRFCPAPLYLDGRLISGAKSAVALGGLLRWETAVKSPELESFVIPRPKISGQPVAWEDETYWNLAAKPYEFQFDRRLSVTLPSGEAPLLLEVPWRPGAPEQLYFLHHGALIDGPHLLQGAHSGSGLQAIVKPVEIATDLSEFRALGDHHELVSKVRSQLSGLCEAFLACAEQSGENKSRPSARSLGAGLLGVGALLKAPLLLSAVTLPLAAVAGLGYSTVSKMKRTQQKLKLLDNANRIRALRRTASLHR